MILCRNAKNISGVEFLVGFETEFILLKNTNPIEVVNHHEWCEASASASGTIESQVLEEIADALRMADVELQCITLKRPLGGMKLSLAPFFLCRQQMPSY